MVEHPTEQCVLCPSCGHTVRLFQTTRGQIPLDTSEGKQIFHGVKCDACNKAFDADLSKAFFQNFTDVG
jgi:hypothetical protein